MSRLSCAFVGMLLMQLLPLLVSLVCTGGLNHRVLGLWVGGDVAVDDDDDDDDDDDGNFPLQNTIVTFSATQRISVSASNHVRTRIATTLK